MNKRTACILSIIVLFSINISAIIFKSDTITAIKKHAQKGTLVLFDLDDTLVKTPELIGSDTWFGGMATEKLKKGLTFDQAVEQILPIYLFVRNIVDLELIESTATTFIQNLQKQNIQVMGLTAQSMPLAPKTTSEIKRLEIQFSIKETDGRILDLGITHNAKFIDGIIFAGSNNKGDILFQFLDMINVTPKKIIFIDDKESNVKKVERAVEARGIKFVGLHFTGADAWKNKFNQTLADKQLHKFKVKYGMAPRNKQLPKKIKKKEFNERTKNINSAARPKKTIVK